MSLHACETMRKRDVDRDIHRDSDWDGAAQQNHPEGNTAQMAGSVGDGGPPSCVPGLITQMHHYYTDTVSASHTSPRLARVLLLLCGRTANIRAGI